MLSCSRPWSLGEQLGHRGTDRDHAVCQWQGTETTSCSFWASLRLSAWRARLTPPSSVPAASLQERLEHGDDGVLVAGDHQHTAEFVKQHQQLGAPHVLVVHDLLQVVPPSEVVQQPAGSRARENVGQTQLELMLPLPRPPLPWHANQKVVWVMSLICMERELIMPSTEIPWERMGLTRCGALPRSSLDQEVSQSGPLPKTVNFQLSYNSKR